jgi:hypothetical protein
MKTLQTVPGVNALFASGITTHVNYKRLSILSVNADHWRVLTHHKCLNVHGLKYGDGRNPVPLKRLTFIPQAPVSTKFVTTPIVTEIIQQTFCVQEKETVSIKLIKFSPVFSRVKWLKVDKTDVSRTISVLVVRENEVENFINLSRRESLKSYVSIKITRSSFSIYSVFTFIFSLHIHHWPCLQGYPRPPRTPPVSCAAAVSQSHPRYSLVISSAAHPVLQRDLLLVPVTRVWFCLSPMISSFAPKADLRH